MKIIKELEKTKRIYKVLIDEKNIHISMYIYLSASSGFLFFKAICRANIWIIVFVKIVIYQINETIVHFELVNAAFKAVIEVLFDAKGKLSVAAHSQQAICCQVSKAYIVYFIKRCIQLGIEINCQRGSSSSSCSKKKKKRFQF
jgi:hypothetical protein